MSKAFVVLHNTVGSSNKTYEVYIELESDGYIVRVRFGPIGRANQTKIKTPEAVTLEQAIEIATSLEAEKFKKGYRVVSRNQLGTATASPVRLSQPPTRSPYPLMLLSEAEPRHVPILIANPAYWMQQKHDGERRPVACIQNAVLSFNKRSEPADLGPCLNEQFTSVGSDFVIDGEQVGDAYWAFDLIMLDRRDYTSEPFSVRYSALIDLFKRIPDQSGIQLSKVYRAASEKQDALKHLEENGQEGVVFRLANGAYVDGRPVMSGLIMKHKFYKEASVVVLAKNEGRASVSMGVIDTDGTMTGIGSVTIPPNTPFPTDGSVIEVRYLYAYRGGSLFQPTFKSHRTDVCLSECRIDQLRYKCEAA